MKSASATSTTPMLRSRAVRKSRRVVAKSVVGFGVVAVSPRLVSRSPAAQRQSTYCTCGVSGPFAATVSVVGGVGVAPPAVAAGS